MTTVHADVPRFYTAQARDADVVQCEVGHLVGRETARTVGRLEYSTWACPYCCYPDSEQRQLVMRAYELGLKDGRAGRDA